MRWPCFTLLALATYVSCAQAQTTLHGSGTATAGSTVLAYSSAIVDTANTNTAQTVFTYNVPGGTLGATHLLRFTMVSDQLNNGALGTFTVAVTFGGVTLFNHAGINPPNSATRSGYYLQVNLSANNATGAQVSQAWATAAATVNTSGVAQGVGSGYPVIATNNAVGVDSTVAQTYLVTVTNTAASANLSWRKLYAILELL